MNTFKVGDKVKVVDVSGAMRTYAGKEGQIFTVTAIRGDLVYTDAGSGGMYPERFQLMPPTNGVDRYGNAVLFTVNDLKPFQRVVLGNGSVGVVSINGGGDVALTQSDNTWSDATFNSHHGAEWNIVKVYAAPNHWGALDIDERGELLFEVKDLAAERAAKLKAANEAIHATRVALALAEAAKAAI